MRQVIFSGFALFTLLSALGTAGCTTTSTQLVDDGTNFVDASYAAPIPTAKPDEPTLAVANAMEEPVLQEGEIEASEFQDGEMQAESFVAALNPVAGIRAFPGGSRERECLMRAMYFESNRSSKEGLLAVGTVVMNRVSSGNYPNSVCGVVGQKRQFASGVMSRRVQGNTADLAALADAILKGKRHPSVKKAMHFHQAGLKFHYGNMHYVLTAGGNSFYEKRSRRRR